MAREIPYFKFFTGEYLTGDITLCDINTQGVFVNICCYYWNKQGHYFLANAKQRFNDNIKEIDELVRKNIIKVENDMIQIDFLDAQLKERTMLHNNRVVAGRKGGKTKKIQANGDFCLSKVKPIRKEKKRKEKKRQEKNKAICTIQQWQKHFFEYAKKYFAFPIAKVKCDALALNSYEYWSDKNWLRDKQPMKSWKQTVESKVRRENTKLRDWDVKEVIDNGVGGM